MVFKEKYLPTSVFEKLKARFVAGGDVQDRSLYSESQLSSKTESTTSVFSIAALAAKGKRAVAVVDFPGAYLNREMPKDGEKVHMKLDQYMTGVIVSLDPSYKEFVNEDGTYVVQVVKGLYGLKPPSCGATCCRACWRAWDSLPLTMIRVYLTDKAQRVRLP
jgi:hypothetical protein